MEEKSIAEDSLLETDLGIYGADAMEHMVAFGKHFSVDVSKFMAAEYFSAEGGLKLPPWLAKLFKVQEHFLYNLFFQVSVLFALLFANTFVNDLWIPHHVERFNGKPSNDSKSLGISAVIKTAALVAEAAFFIALIYLVNKILIDYFLRKEKSINDLKLTTRIHALVAGIFIIILIFGSYRGFL